ncbi:MAG TPA: cyanophycinase [Gemmatimonadaceae bacterium]|nr:cyanophycinase [Gemmatimonadaceae bacterium]
MTHVRGSLIVIGGHEDKQGDRVILREVAGRAGPGGKLVVATVASSEPEIYWEEYQRVFRALGVRHVHHLDVRSRAEALADRTVRVLEGATAVFFTGGDQLRIASELGNTPVYDRLCAIYEVGGTIAGTSAGASMMCETMLVRGEEERSARLGAALVMAPGLGFVKNAIIDQHFAQRGRIGRLLGAVAHNPRVLGIGIDENTAAIFERAHLTVLGENAVYVVDGSMATYSNIAEEEEDRALALFGVRLHVLSQGSRFELASREPVASAGAM